MRILYLFLIFLISCSSSDDSENTDDLVIDTDDIVDTDDNENTESELYFPPVGSTTWETISPDELGWDTTALNALNAFVEDTNAKAFIILKDGKMAFENYYQDTDASTSHRWNSAAKTLTAYTIGIAQQEGFLDISNPTSDYLGQGWTTMSAEQENAISIRNQLTMTTGGNYTVEDINCTDPECLTYLNAAGTEWYYHNAYYTLLQDAVTGAVPEEFNTYFDTKIKEPTGMTGAWIPFGYYRLFYSTARSMARFGLLNLNQGVWDDHEIINPSYFTEMTTPSQSLNEAYGYLWWLNGQDTFRLPGTTFEFPGKLIPTAPDDLFAGLGKDDQKMYVVPSEGLVVVRLGDASGTSTLGPSGFDTELWERIMEVID